MSAPPSRDKSTAAAPRASRAASRSVVRTNARRRDSPRRPTPATTAPPPTCAPAAAAATLAVADVLCARLRPRWHPVRDRGAARSRRRLRRVTAAVLGNGSERDTWSRATAQSGARSTQASARLSAARRRRQNRSNAHGRPVGAPANCRRRRARQQPRRMRGPCLAMTRRTSLATSCSVLLPAEASARPRRFATTGSDAITPAPRAGVTALAPATLGKWCAVVVPTGGRIVAPIVVRAESRSELCRRLSLCHRGGNGSAGMEISNRHEW